MSMLSLMFNRCAAACWINEGEFVGLLKMLLFTAYEPTEVLIGCWIGGLVRFGAFITAL